MPTIPTGELEREMRKRYLRFISGLSMDSKNLSERLREFEAAQLDLIERMGGRTAALGALGDFPAPKSLDLSPWAGTVYNEMQTTAIQAGIIAGSSSKEAAQQMFRAGMDKSYRKLERLARTETTNAYWKNAWGSIADLPLLVMLWGSEDGPRTCAWCRERDGLVMDGPSVRDHPNGRCTPIPTLRSDVQYRGSIKPDGTIYHDPAWKKTQDARFQTQPAVLKDAISTLPDGFVPKAISNEDIAAGMTAAERQRVALEKQRFTRKGALNADAGWDYPTQRAWTSYIEMGHKDMNAMLRDPKAYAASPEYDEYFANLFSTQIDQLKGLLSKNTLADDVVVARGVTVAKGFNPADLVPGSSFADPAFISTTTNLKEAADFAAGRGYRASEGGGWTFITRAPKGTQAIPGADYQNELVFKPGQMQRVLSVDPDQRIVYTEMIP